MSLLPYNEGALQFTLKVNALDTVDPYSLEKSKSVFMDLDLNPNAKIYEDTDDTFNAERLANVFEFLKNLVTYLDESDFTKQAGGERSAANQFLSQYYKKEIPPMKRVHSKRIV